MNSDASTVDLATDPLGFAIEALGDRSRGAPEAVAAARRARAILDSESFPRASVDAARALALGVRALALGGQPVAPAVAREAIEAAECWLESASPAEESARADAQEARGVARLAVSEQADGPDARMLEAAAMDLLAAAQYRQQAGDAEAAARTDLEIAEAFAVYPADDRAPLIERAVGHARRAAGTLTPEVDPTAHARCQLLLSGLLLDHPRSDPQQFAPAAQGLADTALTVVDEERAPLVAARAWQARARAQEIRGLADHTAAYARAAELLDIAGLTGASRRLRQQHGCA
ncbi:MAG: hypothetical protein OXG64_06190 [Chloroflexi bacterium]|nr:hypothetical protein [Chloroflexota bacterium]MCY3959106.1 hypothetical protein [Chloroflexota bacterium]